jgi:hypothetical protein
MSFVIPKGNAWNFNSMASFSISGYSAMNGTEGFISIYAVKGFPISVEPFSNNIYYFEVHVNASEKW